MGNSSSQVSSYVAAPYYPAPHGGWVSSWEQSYAQAKALVGQMTLAEKTNITSGTGIFMGTHAPFPAPSAFLDTNGLHRVCHPQKNSNKVGKLNFFSVGAASATREVLSASASLSSV